MAKRKRVLWLLATAAVVAAGISLWSHRFGVAQDYTGMEEQFKYGSIGSDHPLAEAPLPYWIWKVLPQIFPPSTVIAQGYGPRNNKTGYDAFGLVTEPQMDRPIGFSKRTVLGLDFVGLNCAFCHLTTLRKAAADPQTDLILGGTGNSVDIEKYFLYLFAALTNEHFNADEVMKAVLAQDKDMGWLERTVYRYAIIPYIKFKVAGLQKQFDFIDPINPKRLPKFGPGRVDTWAAYKRIFVNPPQRDSISGIVNFPPIWNQKARIGMRLHWDGNTDVLEERNIVSALAVIGPRLDYLDLPRLTRVTDWIMGLVPPRYEDRVPSTVVGGQTVPRIRHDLADQGRTLFQDRCGACHDATGDRIGRVEPLADLGTDAGRLKAFTNELTNSLNRLGTDAWTLRNFKPQSGYANMLIDGVWLRGPYLHNGSVPTLRDLLHDVDQRPKQFCRGSDLYDWKNVGFVVTIPTGTGDDRCGELFLYDTTIPGNGNQGHLYGTELSEPDKEALLEFLKTL